jgi:hypothetical protein
MSLHLITSLNFVRSDARKEICDKKMPRNLAFHIICDNGNILPHCRKLEFPRAPKCCWYYVDLPSLRGTSCSSRCETFRGVLLHYYLEFWTCSLIFRVLPKCGYTFTLIFAPIFCNHVHKVKFSVYTCNVNKKKKTRISIAEYMPPLASVLLKLIFYYERKTILKCFWEGKKVRSFLVDRPEIVGNDLRPVQKTMWRTCFTNKVNHEVRYKILSTRHGGYELVENSEYIYIWRHFACRRLTENNKPTELYGFLYLEAPDLCI